MKWNPAPRSTLAGSSALRFVAGSVPEDVLLSAPSSTLMCLRPAPVSGSKMRRMMRQYASGFSSL